MTVIWVFLVHHALWLSGLGVAALFAPSVLRQRRPTGSAFAWLLALVLIPYVGIPLYAVFGGRKFRGRVAAKGVLTLGSARVPVQVQVQGQVQGDDRRRPTVESVLGADIPAPSHLSSLRWFSDGEQAFRGIIEAIEGAERSIRIVTYLVGSDETGAAVLSALARRAAAGVVVELLIDDLLFYRAPHALVAALEAAGGKVARFMPLLHLPFRGRANLRNHRKIAIFDGKRAVLGGMNLAEEYMGPRPLEGRWRDLALAIEGPPVATLEGIFHSDWRFAVGARAAAAPAEAPAPAGSGSPGPATSPAPTVFTAAPGGALAQVVPSGPDRPDDSLYDVLLQAVFGARERVWIATPYFVPDDSLYKALELAVRRGVEVRVVVPARSNHRLADFVAASLLRDLGRAGVDVWRFAPGMLHAKAVLVDQQLAVVGSANFDLRSLYLDYEVALLLYGADEARWLATWFETTCASASRGVPEAGRLIGTLQTLARLLAPLV
jgi:cardiolipin synthase